MDSEERAALIRRGNEFFNQSDYKSALKIFLATDYKDGIIRVADYLYFEKKDKISAIKLYKKANHHKVIDDFTEKAAALIRILLAEDKQKADEEAVKKEMAGAFMKEWKPVTLSGEEIANMNKGDKSNDS
jgi:hypothetical protein